MQTFLPCPNFADSAKILDNKRLGKQRAECLQILKALHNPNYGWQNHPAVKMWRKSESWLACYGLCICDEWRNRGFDDSCYEKIRVFSRDLENKPEWLGNEKFHSSHRAALLMKNPEWYSQFGWTERPEIRYVWPT